ncbi:MULTISPECIES: 4-hydroxybenzoate polyprenyltransferase [Prochlorococcus]|uniref:4-hydroxybenzoate polyprenyltransferase n=1 Tax=Prochlorococcus TaxID=1218 RepID=UPI000533907F|nr:MULTISPECIES: 4-hydroxybenzoate polyprenyltransferase [Prochlorococcus]KGG12937.1 Cyanobacterial polyprenyltransferase UbiA-like [Prochlorococcus sp. MIT 0601]
MKIQNSTEHLIHWIELLRWNKPSGRIILLIPAGWSLWLTPSAPPSGWLVGLIILGGIFISGAGCIANDLWDMNIDKKVQRTKDRPLASRNIKLSTAWILLFSTLILSLLTIFLLPSESQILCLQLALISIVPILIYPSSKRWFKYPQALLAICWGFSVLIPWAAMESTLNGGWPLISCWIATLTWTFGFDTVYAMSDKSDDRKLGIKSSALSLGEKALPIVSICYGITSLFLAYGAFNAGKSLIFWLILFISSIGMQKEVILLKKHVGGTSNYSRHFTRQVLLGSFILLGLILS